MTETAEESKLLKQLFALEVDWHGAYKDGNRQMCDDIDVRIGMLSRGEKDKVFESQVELTLGIIRNVTSPNSAFDGDSESSKSRKDGLNQMLQELKDQLKDRSSIIARRARRRFDWLLMAESEHVREETSNFYTLFIVPGEAKAQASAS